MKIQSMKILTGKSGIVMAMFFSIVTGTVTMIVTNSFYKSVLSFVGAAFIIGGIAWMADDYMNKLKDEEKLAENENREKTNLKIELAEWRHGLGDLDWHDNRTKLQRLIAYFGKDKVQKMLEYDLLYEYDITDEHN